MEEIYQRKKARLDAKYGTALRKQSQVPVTPEAKFRTRATDKGYKVYRPIWPDNIIEKDGKIAFVEVKSADDIVSPEQALTFDLLEKHGIPVYVWQDAKESSGSFVRWGNGVEAKRILCGGREIDSHAYNRFCESLGQQGEVVA